MTVATGWDTAVSLIFRARVGELLLNTILLMAVSVPLCLVLGVGGAWLVERTSLRGNRFWALALAAPLAIPAFVNSYGWVSAVPSLAGLWSGVLISVLSYFPLVYIPAAATLSRLDPSLEESAASLGLGPWQVFRRVVLPQLRLAMTGGALLVGLHLLAEYGAFAMIRFDTFTTAIMVQYQSTFNGAAGNMLASVLVVLCLLLLVAEVRSRGTARYARVGSGGQAAPGRMPLGRLHVPAQLALLLLVVLAVGVPMWFVVRWVVLGGSEIWAPDELVPALLQTLRLRRGRCGRDDARRLPDGLPRGAPTELVHPLPRAVQLHHELDARHRRRPRLRHRDHPLPAGVLPDGRRPRRGLRAALPAACPGQSPLGARAGAAGARGGRAGARGASPRRLRPGHAAAHGAGRRRGSGARLPRHRQRADGDPPARPERHHAPSRRSSGPRAARSTTPAPRRTPCSWSCSRHR